MPKRRENPVQKFKCLIGLTVQTSVENKGQKLTLLPVSDVVVVGFGAGVLSQIKHFHVAPAALPRPGPLMCRIVYNQSTVAKFSPAGLVLQCSSSSALLPKAELLLLPQERCMSFSSSSSVLELSEGQVCISSNHLHCNVEQGHGLSIMFQQ